MYVHVLSAYTFVENMPLLLRFGKQSKVIKIFLRMCGDVTNMFSSFFLHIMFQNEVRSKRSNYVRCFCVT